MRGVAILGAQNSFRSFLAWLNKHRSTLVAAIIVWLPALWRGLIWLFDWESRIETTINDLRWLGWAEPMIAFLLDPPGWVVFPSLGLGFLILWVADQFPGVSKPMTVPNSSKTKKVAITITAAAFIFCGGAAWYFLSVQIHPAFREIYRAKKQELGAPIQPAGNSHGAYEAWMQHAYVIWMVNPGIMCGFDMESRKTPVCTEGAFHAISTEPELFDEAYVKGKLKLTKSEYWPRGSLAYYLGEGFEAMQSQRWL